MQLTAKAQRRVRAQTVHSLTHHHAIGRSIADGQAMSDTNHIKTFSASTTCAKTGKNKRKTNMEQSLSGFPIATSADVSASPRGPSVHPYNPGPAPEGHAEAELHSAVHVAQLRSCCFIFPFASKFAYLRWNGPLLRSPTK